MHLKWEAIFYNLQYKPILLPPYHVRAHDNHILLIDESCFHHILKSRLIIKPCQKCLPL